MKDRSKQNDENIGQPLSHLIFRVSAELQPMLRAPQADRLISDGYCSLDMDEGSREGNRQRDNKLTGYCFAPFALLSPFSNNPCQSLCSILDLLRTNGVSNPTVTVVGEVTVVNVTNDA
jgi:hypothetical protein